MEDDERQALLTRPDRDNPEPRVHITFADMGIPPTRRLHLTFLGEARHCSDISLTDRVYITLVLLSITAAAIPTIYQLSTSGAQTQDYTFCSVLLVNTVFNVWYILEGVLKERPPEIAVLTLSLAVNMAYVGVNYTSGHRDWLTLTRLVVTAVFCPALVILGIIVTWTYYVSRRLIFRTVGANATLQAFYIILLVFQDLLKLDLQLAISSIIFSVTCAPPMTTQDVTLLSVGSIFAVAWSTLGLCAHSGHPYTSSVSLASCCGRVKHDGHKYNYVLPPEITSATVTWDVTWKHNISARAACWWLTCNF